MLWWFWTTIVACTVINILVTAYYRYVRHWLTFPYSNPFFQKFSFQYDYYCYQERMKYFHQERFFHMPGQPFSYPALLALAYKFFYLFGKPGHPLYLTIVIGGFAMAAWMFARALVRRGVRPVLAYLFAATMFLSSYPLGLLVYLANMEGLVWLATALGVWALVKDRDLLAAGLFGLAGALKIFPLVYLGVFLARRQYKPFFFGLAVFAVINLLALAVLGPTIPIAFRGINEGLHTFQFTYVYQFKGAENGMDHSLYEVVKIPFKMARRLDLLPKVSAVYLATAALTGITLFFTTLRRLPFLNLLLTLCTASLVLPQQSHDYNLMQLYALWMLLVLFVLDHRPRGAVERGVQLAMACFVLLFTAQAWLIVHKIRFAGQLKAVVLVALFLVAMRWPFRTEQDAPALGQPLYRCICEERRGALQRQRCTGPESSQAVSLPANVLAYAALQFALGVIFLIWSAIYWHRGHRDVVHAWPFAGFERFHDFWVFAPRFAHLHRPDFFSTSSTYGLPFPYPAPVGLLYAGFYALSWHPFLNFVLITLTGLAVLAGMFVHALRGRGVSGLTAVAFTTICIVLSYPFWFEYMGGNMEICIFLLVAFGIVAFLNGHNYLAATLFGLAASMKLFPLVYFGLFLARKQVRQVLWGIVIALLSTVSGLWLLTPSLSASWRGISEGLNGFQRQYVLSMRTFEAGFNHSLLSIYSDALFFLTRRPLSLRELHVYLAAVACAGSFVFFWRIWKLPVLNQICTLVIVSIWLTPISYDYTLLHLFVPVALLVLVSLDAQQAGQRVRGLALMLLCSAILLAPECEFIIRKQAGLNGAIKSGVFFLLFTAVLRFPLACRRFPAPALEFAAESARQHRKMQA